MSLFQRNVIAEYLKVQDQKKYERAWEKFQVKFKNKDFQKNIQISKEEQYQEGFLRDLFVDVFGYTLNPQPNYNLTTELKNIKDAKKVDGAILKEGYAIAVIELKGMDTVNLDRIEVQAFRYKNNQTHCQYVITSNFQKIRFYVDDAVEYIEFDLFNISKDDFYILYLILDCNNLLNDLPKKLKVESISQEEKITKQLYTDYSVFKRELFTDLTLKNSHIDSLYLFQKTQKLLDRFLFIFFAEDSGLLPPNTARTMIVEWSEARKLKVYIPLYNHVKNYFNYLDKGYEDKIFAYNGGLFKSDRILDSLKIEDDILYNHISKLSMYDFSSEIDVNILGHIFENSLNELDEIKAQIIGKDVDKSKTKRKKDGIFYTPKYITNYIIINTLKKLCEEKKIELELIEEDYSLEKRRIKKTQKILFDKLKQYREWLLNIAICDPACGSGAFLNEALVFLISEHAYLDVLESQLFRSEIVFSEVRNHILENNLFGVDINEESVEIAKLSLWLRTAEPRRKLNNLSNNIVCGNSLIDDANIAGEKAFDWKKNFPKIFARGGFDIVIGNPPYGAKLDKSTQVYLNQKYIKGGAETAISFIKLSYDLLLKQDGKLGFIIPKSFSYASNYAPIREDLFDDISEIIDCRKVWSEVKLEQVMIFSNKGQKVNDFVSGYLNGKEIILLTNISKDTFKKFGFYLNNISKEELAIGYKINEAGSFIGKISSNSRGGMFQKLICDDGDIEVIGGAQIQRKGIEGNRGLVFKKDMLEEQSYIQRNSILVQNIVSHIENPIDHIKIIATYPETSEVMILDTINQIVFHQDYNAKVFWLLLNSKLVNWYAYRFIFAKAIRTMHFDNSVTNRIPIPEIINQKPFIKLANELLEVYRQLASINTKFLNSITRRFDLENADRLIKDWYFLSYKEFIEKLSRNKIRLSLVEEADWEEYFLGEKSNALEILQIHNLLIQDIDNMIFDMYSLSSNEKDIILTNFKNIKYI